MNSFKKYRQFFILFIGLYAPLVFADELIMSAPPLENLEKSEMLYKPLAKIFSDILGRPVRYVFPDNVFNYQSAMRQGKYDIAFDAAHFASWRIKHLGHDLLVKLTGTIEFVTLVHKKDKTLRSLNDLIGKKICSISPPNLSALTILKRYTNPVQQPILLGIRGGMDKVIARFNSGACDAAVIRNSYYKKQLTANERNSTRIVFQSLPLQNQAFTVSQKISAVEVAKLASAIVYGDAKPVISPIAVNYGGTKAEFLAAEASEYFDQRLLLEGVIFGW